jgi:tetraacyldisaccharide 4'-kinase
MTELSRLAERVWYGTDRAARLARAALAPAAALFRAGVGARGALYDRGVLRVERLPVPALSVGNLTVGGTGKTPVAAWLAERLRARGARPALVLRGVGGDEPRVHALLNPDVPVVTGADRVAGVRAAVALGADSVVLDDGFQHRRAGRDADLVLVSAERFDAGSVRLLPAGPYREGLAALARASAAAVTRKVASPEHAAAIAAELATRVPDVAVVYLAPDTLRRGAGRS